MTTRIKSDRDEALDQDTLEFLGSAPAAAQLPPRSIARVRDRVMSCIDTDMTSCENYTTIRANEGEWTELEPLVHKKLLGVDSKTGQESYLLRMHPGATLPRHHHDNDELCVVLEGDVSFDDIHLNVGDYHCAHKGSWHGRAGTVQGALLFLQSVTATTATA